VRLFGVGIQLGRCPVVYGDGAKSYKYGFWLTGPGEYFNKWEVTIEFDPGRPR
jgi:hypothetical protein